jgi:hypothetical protein
MGRRFAVRAEARGLLRSERRKLENATCRFGACRMMDTVRQRDLGS